MKRLRLILPVAVLSVLAFPAAALATTTVSISPQTSAGEFDFGTVDIGHAARQQFTVTNTGTTRTRPLRITLAGYPGFSKISTTCHKKRLAPHKTCLINIRFTPTTDGIRAQATLYVSNWNYSMIYAAINLFGTGHGTADLVWTPVNSYDFGTLAGLPESEAFTVTNTGTATATLDTSAWSYTAPILEPDQFCSDAVTSLAPGESCTETWTADPSGCPPNSSGTAIGSDHLNYYIDSTLTTTAAAYLDVTAECPGS